MIKATYGFPISGALGDSGEKPLLPAKALLGRRGAPLGRLWSGLFVACALSLGSFACLAPAFSDSPSNPDLERMEQKFFQHSYAKDELTTRLERLEKMVFGEAKTGSDADRLAKLGQAIPATSPSEPSPGTDTASGGGNSDVASTPRRTPARTPKTPAAPPTNYDDNDVADKPAPGDEKYPAVTAIEQKVLGRDYAQDPVNQRLARLETKVFGKPSGSTDLSDRVDALKGRTGIDITRQHPRGSDWSDDDDDDDSSSTPPVARSHNRNGGGIPGNNPQADGMSFSGRNLRQDMNQFFGANAGSGSYGFGGSGTGMGAGFINPTAPSGSYGSGAYRGGGQAYGGGNQGYTSPYGGGSPSYSSPSGRGSYRSAPPAMADSGLGLTQQVTALETSVFGKTYHDALPDRLSRLEATVFPQQKPSDDQTLPDRVSRLAAVIPIDTSQNKRVAQRPDDYVDMDGTPAQQQAQRQKNNGGLSKIMNSLSGMFGGGMGGGMNGGMTGGYAMQPGTLATDPQTGMLIDPSTGNLIDPNTGAVVGRRTTGSYGGYSSGMNMGGMGGMGGFNEGFSPCTMSRYGGSRGLGFGFGGLGGGRGFGF